MEGRFDEAAKAEHGDRLFVAALAGAAEPSEVRVLRDCSRAIHFNLNIARQVGWGHRHDFCFRDSRHAARELSADTN